jgi:hypothetical protein
VRFLATLLMWLLATASLAVAVPAMWAQHNVVDRAGYSTLAARAAENPVLQAAMAGEITTQVTNQYSVNESVVRTAARAYTASTAFPGQFAALNELAHRWMFTEAAQQDGKGWVVDIGPLLNDSSIKDPLAQIGVQVPQSLTVPISSDLPDNVRPGQLRQLTKWGPGVSIGACVLTGVFALLTLAAAKRRGKAFAALGVSALIVGAAGWAGIEVLRRRIDQALNVTSGDIRQVADVMVGQAISSLHLWLNLTLAAGGVLVAFGVIAAVLGGVRERTVSEPVRR